MGVNSSSMVFHIKLRLTHLRWWKQFVDGLIQDWVDQQQGRPTRLLNHGDLCQWIDELFPEQQHHWRHFHGSAFLNGSPTSTCSSLRPWTSDIGLDLGFESNWWQVAPVWISTNWQIQEAGDQVWVHDRALPSPGDFHDPCWKFQREHIREEHGAQSTCEFGPSISQRVCAIAESCGHSERHHHLCPPRVPLWSLKERKQPLFALSHTAHLRLQRGSGCWFAVCPWPRRQRWTSHPQRDLHGNTLQHLHHGGCPSQRCSFGLVFFPKMPAANVWKPKDHGPRPGGFKATSLMDLKATGYNQVWSTGRPLSRMASLSAEAAYSKRCTTRPVGFINLPAFKKYKTWSMKCHGHCRPWQIAVATCRPSECLESSPA